MATLTTTLQSTMGKLVTTLDAGRGVSTTLQVAATNLQSEISIGTAGPAGPPGADGAAAAYHRHDQVVPSDAWVINHNIGSCPGCKVFSVGGREMQAEVVNVALNQVQILFDSPTAGYAVFS